MLCSDTAYNLYINKMLNIHRCYQFAACRISAVQHSFTIFTVMKKILLPVLFLISMAVQSAAQSHDQKPTTPAPTDTPSYIKNPSIPVFKILETDSVTFFSTEKIPKGKKSVLVFFDPTCSHCINFMDKLFPAMDLFKDVNFYMITSNHNMSLLIKFCETYKTKEYKNIKMIGRDPDFFFIHNYNIKNYPAAAIYDKNKKFMQVFESNETTVENILQYTSK